MNIRPPTLGDIPAIKSVILATGLFPAEMLDEMILPFLEGTAGHAQWFTIGDHAPFGVAYCAPERMTDGAWNLLLIAIHPDQQGQGHGARLMRHVEENLRGSGQRILLVETSGLSEFEQTRAFYAKLGYTSEARIRDYYKDGEDKIVFRKALASV